MANSEYNYIPTYIRRTINNRPKDVVTASYWNELFNLLITQGDHTAEELGNILNHFSTRLVGLQSKSITDTGSYFTTDTVEGALQEIGAGLAGTYSKPSGGIPESDLTFDVRTKLNAREKNIITIETENVDPLNPYKSSKTLTAIKNDFTHNIEQFVFYDNISYKLEKIITDTGVEKAVFYSTARLVNDVLTYYTCEIYEGNFGYSTAGFHTYTVSDRGAVESVNGKTGAVTLNASDVGAQRPLTAGSGIMLVEAEDGTTIIQSDAVGGGGIVSFVDVAGGAPIASFTLNQTEDCEINVNDLIRTPLLNNYRTAAAQDVIDAGKQDKLIAGEGITIAADGKTISARGKVSSVNGQTGDVVLNADSVGAQRPLIAGSGIAIIPSDNGDIIQSNVSVDCGNGLVSFVNEKGGASIAQFTLNQTQDCEINVNDLTAHLHNKFVDLETSDRKLELSLSNNYRTAAAQDVIDNTKLTDAPTDGKEYARKNGSWHEIAVVDVGVEKVNGKTGVVTLNATEIPSTKLVPTDTISFLIDGAFDEGLVELTRNGVSASANDFISAINSGATVTVGLNDQGNPKVSFDTQPVKYKITGDTLSLCFIAEVGHQYTPAIYVLSGTTGGATVSTLVEHNFTDAFYQENYVSANDLPVQAPLSVEEYLEALDATNQSIITDLETIRSGSTPATVEKLGLVRIGENLKITKDGILSVDTANAVEQDNTKPITSAAVHAAIGNIEVLLAAL